MMKMLRNRKGFTLVEIMIVVAIIGLLAAIAVPSFIQARTTSRTNACINNLRLIEAAKEQYAMANNLADGDAVTQGQIATYMRGTAFPVCPAGGTYDEKVVGTAATCDQPNHVLPV